jgi:hypothetical protein
MDCRQAIGLTATIQTDPLAKTGKVTSTKEASTKEATNSGIQK